MLQAIAHGGAQRYCIVVNVSRHQIIQACKIALESLPQVQAAFLGGSDAFGRVDDYSDIDLMFIAPDSANGGAFAAVEAGLERLSPVVLKLPMPPVPAWPGLSQTHYRLRDTNEYLKVDVCRLTPEQTPTFLDPTRHGMPVVLFDKTGIIREVPQDNAELAALIAQRVDWLRAMFPMFQNHIRKAVLRGDLVEAMAMWVGQTMRPLVDLLRVRHCPARFDYGFRYTRLDLPAPVHEKLRGLLWPQDAEDMLAKLDEARAWFEETLAEVDAG